MSAASWNGWIPFIVFESSVDPEAMEESTDREAREPDAELQNLADWYRYLVQADPGS